MCEIFEHVMSESVSEREKKRKDKKIKGFLIFKRRRGKDRSCVFYF